MANISLALCLSFFLFNIKSIDCFRSFRLRALHNFDELGSKNPEIVGGELHSCYRNCNEGTNRTCDYTFLVSQYTSMSYACQDCPIKQEDCFLKGCITAGGYVRPVTVANHMLPGPSIQVCEGDRVRVKVINTFSSDSVTIHWHGMRQLLSPFMDGTPYVTQCPILPHNEFVYDFIASPAGTHVWHSHIGFEEADGLYGSFVVRKPNDPMQKYYDADLAEHVMTIWHWYNTSTVNHLATALHLKASAHGQGFLINGLSPKVEFVSGNNSYETPRKIFHVDAGKRYRFRVINNSPMYCPIQLSIDNHDLLMIASEMGTFEPVSVSSFFINAGERFDFVLHSDQKPANYWIRLKGSGSCKKNDVKLSELAILHYNTVEEAKPLESMNKDSYRRGAVLNPILSPNENIHSDSVIRIIDLNSTNSIEDISLTPNHTFYFKTSFNTYDSYFAPGPYPQINDIAFDYPPVPLLTQHDELHETMYCTEEDHSNKECIAGFCTCPLIYRVTKDSLVEMVFVDLAQNMHHPMHIHGHGVYVVAMETLGKNVSLEAVKQLNQQGFIKKKLTNAPYKDNVSIPGQGFVIIRFKASNPGYWLVHCHIGNHAEMGMGFVLKVGEHEDMVKPPKDFPKCGHWQMN